jgi:PAS domain S-box-containing protein
MPDGWIEQDANGVITGWSPEAGLLYGWSRDEAIGMRADRLVPERNRARHAKALQTFLASAADRIERQEITAMHRDGREFRAECDLSIEHRNGEPRVAAKVRAITPEDRTAEAFRHSNERYRAILDQIEDGCCVVDLRGNYLFVNDAFCRLYGFDKREILGSNFRLSSGPERADKLREMYSQVYRTGQPIKAFEYEVTPKDRPPMFVEQSISLERDADGRPIGFLAITRDCTERKCAQQELAKAKEAAEAANHAKSEFLANMSHEIRTPMNGILGMTSLALDSHLTPEQAECLHTIRNQAESLLTIVNDILDFSKIESRFLEIEAIPFTLADAIDDVVRPMTLRAHEKGLTLSSRIAAGVPAHVIADPVRVKQVLTNLLGNAVKFTERGSVTLDVSAGPGPTGSAAPPNSLLLHFRIVDTGIGIPHDKHALIFEPFRQVDGSTTRRFGGTGLGLAIASTLVELMGGEIRVESAAGAGSTFHASLPVTAAGAVAERRRAISAAAPSIGTTGQAARSRRILVAEDNIVNQRVASRLLTKRGHVVTVVGNGREALDALQREAFDLVLMDIQMPDMDGFEATTAIRRWERDTGARVRIVAMTAHAMTGDRERCLAAGMDGYLSKPIDQRSLYDVVEQ